MVTVTHIVEKNIRGKPFLEEALIRGVINYGALAEEIHEEVEQEYGKEVKHAAIMMALRRLADKACKKMVHPIKFDKDTDLTVKSDLIELTVRKCPSAISKIRKIYDSVSYDSGDFLTITQGLYEVTIITNEKYKDKFLKLLEGEEIIKLIEHLSSLSVRIPLSSVQSVGFFYAITRALNWEHVNIYEIVSTLTELTLIIHEKELPKAFVTLKKLIEEQR